MHYHTYQEYTQTLWNIDTPPHSKHAAMVPMAFATVLASVCTGCTYVHTLIVLCTFRDIQWNCSTSSCTVGGCNADSVHFIVGQNEGSHWLATGGCGEMNCPRTHQSDSVVVNSSSSVPQRIVPLNYNSDVVRTIMNSGGGALRWRWQTWKHMWRETSTPYCMGQSEISFYCTKNGTIINFSWAKGKYSIHVEITCYIPYYAMCNKDSLLTWNRTL